VIEASVELMSEASFWLVGVLVESWFGPPWLFFFFPPIYGMVLFAIVVSFKLLNQWYTRNHLNDEVGMKS
jgi:hypothetical protein